MTVIKTEVRWADNTGDLKRNLLDGLDTINATKQSVDRLTASMGGEGLFKSANALVAAISQLGDTNKLTTAEQERASATLDKAIEKYKAMGLQVPAAMQTTADALRKVEEPTSAVTTKLGSLSDAIVSSMAGFVSAQAILGAVSTAYHALVGFVSDSIKAYSQSEDAQIKLVSALRQHALATPEVVTQYNDLATAFQRTTIYADEEINAMQALLTQVGGIMPSQMQAALKAATDLAAGLGIDLQSATMLVAKAAAGHTETLGRYGITVNAAEVATKGFGVVLEAINRQFGGQAAAAIDTYSGKVKQIENSWNNVQEALGKIILTNPLVVKALSDITAAAADSDKQSSATSKTLADLAADFGLTDRVTADLVNRLATYVDGVNEVDKANKRLSDMPSPFKKWQDENALPPITAGMKLFNQETAETERQNKLAAEALQKFKDALGGLAVAGDGWKGTLAGIDGETVEAVKYYLDAGVALDKLAAAYYLTDTQAKAIQESLKADNEALKLQASIVEQNAKLWDEFNQMASKGGSAFDDQVAAIDRWALDLEAKAQKAGTDTAEFYDALTALWSAKLHEAAQNASTAMRKTASDAIQSFDAMNSAVMGTATSFDGWNKAVMGVDGSVRTLAGDLLKAADAKRMLDQGNSLDLEHAARDPEINALLKAGWSLENAESLKMARQWGYQPKLYDKYGNLESTPSKDERVPGYASGVTNFAGGLAMVHRDELLVNMPAGTDVIQAGKWGGGGISLTVNVSGVWDARSKRELTGVVHEGLTRVLRQGRLLPQP